MQVYTVKLMVKLIEKVILYYIIGPRRITSCINN